MDKSVHEMSPKMSTKIHPKSVHEKSPNWVTFRGQKCPRDVTKNVHGKSPSKNVHGMSPILIKSVHEMSLSTKCLHPKSGIDVGPTVINLAFFSRPYSLIKGPTFIKFWNFFHGLHIFSCLIGFL